MLQYHHYIEIVTLFIGLSCFNKAWNLPYKILLLFIGLTCLVEITGYYISQRYGNNSWIYNIYSPIECLVILYFFNRVILKRKLKDIVSFTIPLMIIATVITYGIQPNIMVYNHYAHSVYLVLWIIVCGFYFMDVMVNDNRMSLTKQPGFWLASGILVFSVLFIILINMHTMIQLLPNKRTIISYFIIIANTFMYVGFAGAFICQRIATKYYSRSSPQA